MKLDIDNLYSYNLFQVSFRGAAQSIDLQDGKESILNFILFEIEKKGYSLTLNENTNSNEFANNEVKKTPQTLLLLVIW